MKRALQITLLLAALFIVSDQLWSTLVAALHTAYTRSLANHPWQFSTYKLAYLLLSAVVFIAAGAVLAWFIPHQRLALLLAFGIGAAVPASGLFFEQPHPWFIQDHGVTLQVLAISWANWWLPALACLLGAITMSRLCSKLGRARACGPTNHTTGPCA